MRTAVAGRVRVPARRAALYFTGRGGAGSRPEAAPRPEHNLNSIRPHQHHRFASGTRLGSYEVVGPLGAGGMGEVYLGRDTRLEREVALKVLPSRLTHDAESIARFRREALTLASLNHPNLATVHGFEEAAEGTLVLVLERIEGLTLAERLTEGALGVEDTLQLCAQVAQALEVAHERGVIHRDLKPGNLMIGPRGLVKVLDFGLARRTVGLLGSSPGVGDATLVPPFATVEGNDDTTDGRATPRSTDDDDTVVIGPSGGAGAASWTASMTGMTVGTPGYMSPEQILAHDVDGRTDVFSLGCVLYECLTRRRAFPGSTAEQAMRTTLEAEPDLTALPERVPPRVRSMIQRCLAKAPAERPESMRTIRLEIEDALGIRRASALREGGTVAAPHNLPTPATSFIGRAATLLGCENALRETRLLTLLGMGGSGKTRLALRLAETRRDSFADGVWFVDVAPLADPDRLDEALAAALGIRDEAGRTLLDGIAHALAGRRALVLLDNAETHLAACVRLTSRLLASCPDLKILVTSREPLALEAETTFTVTSLGVPAKGPIDAAAVSGYDSALLFAERAKAVLPDFEITDDNAGAVAEICRRLDGIPLAIELAAARVLMLGVEQIRARLDDRFRLLRGTGMGADSGRHRTVREVIQWSWDHLHESERALMRRLAVFSGGWTLERASVVVAEDANEFDVLDLLTRLVARSLVVVDRDRRGNARYRFLESVWRFAQEMFAVDPERDTVRDRHLATYAEFAKHVGVELMGSGLAHAVAEVAREEENFLAALAWCDHAADGGRRGLQILGGIYRAWSIRGHYAAARRLIEQGLKRDANREPSVERARILTRLSGFAATMGDYPAAARALEESLRIFRALDDAPGIASVLGGLSVMAMIEGRYEDAWKLCEECRAAYERQNQPRGVAMALHNMGTLEWVGGRGDHGRANFESALALFRRVGDHGTEALCLSALASSLVRVGEPEAAEKRLCECLRLLEHLEAPRESLYTLEAVAELMIATGRMSESARILGVAKAARVALGAPLMPHERIEVEKLALRIAEAVGSETYDREMANGERLSLAEGLAETAKALGMSWSL